METKSSLNAGGLGQAAARASYERLSAVTVTLPFSHAEAADSRLLADESLTVRFERIPHAFRRAGTGRDQRAAQIAVANAVHRIERLEITARRRRLELLNLDRGAYDVHCLQNGGVARTGDDQDMIAVRPR